MMTKKEREYVRTAFENDRHSYRIQLYGFVKPRLHGEFTLTVYAVSDTKRYGLRIIEVNRAWSDRPYYVCKNIWKNMFGTTMVEFDERRNRPELSYAWYDDKWGGKCDWAKNPSWFMQYVRYANLDALAETKYKYCAYAQYDGDMPLVPYCRLFAKHKAVELLAKAQLSQFITPRMLDRLAADKPFHNFVRSHVREIAERRTRPQTVVRAYKHGWTIQRAENEEQLRYAYRGIPEGVDKRELQKYLAANDIDFHDYLHYCEAAERAGWNIRAFGRTFPRDLHAATIEARETRKRKNEAKFLAVSKRINYLLEWMRRKVELRVGAYTFVVPTTEQEFIEEGKAMRNCIGRYYQYQLDGSAFCFFIHKDGKRHADVEMSSRGVIRQCRLFANEAADTETRTVAEQMAKTFAEKMRKAA